jgi:hypothetical protein
MNLKTLDQTNIIKPNSNDTHLIGCMVTKGDVYIDHFVIRAIHVLAIVWRALRLLAKHLENTFSSISRGMLL